ncbi:MAG: FAD-dependent oxidoreductase, partial [Opitutales bacterium]|nr:FAD-dependent oxidoreductase [Opitutales bacterium]
MSTEDSKERFYDVIVVGGGISGAMAAIAAARGGAKTLVVEQYGFLGGMLTAAGVGPMMTFHAGDQQVIQGTTGELIDRLVEKKQSPGHVFDTTGFTYTVTPFDVEGMK